jgi:hypothetical protein
MKIILGIIALLVVGAVAVIYGGLMWRTRMVSEPDMSTRCRRGEGCARTGRAKWPW